MRKSGHISNVWKPESNIFANTCPGGIQAQKKYSPKNRGQRVMLNTVQEQWRIVRPCRVIPEALEHVSDLRTVQGMFESSLRSPLFDKSKKGSFGAARPTFSTLGTF